MKLIQEKDTYHVWKIPKSSLRQHRLTDYRFTVATDNSFLENIRNHGRGS